jgi:hypothetical protein
MTVYEKLRDTPIQEEALKIPTLQPPTFRDKLRTKKRVTEMVKSRNPREILW